MSEIEQLAVGFVEATTRYDYAPLPEHVKAALIDAASELSRWMETQGLYRIEPGQTAQGSIDG